MFRSTVTIMALLAVVVAGCTGGGPGPSPSLTPGPQLTTAELRVRLIDTLGPVWYCDPDFYPIAVADEADRAIERFGEVQADTDAFVAIRTHLAIPTAAEFTADQKLSIYRAWKQLNAITLETVGNSSYQFDYLNMPEPGVTDGRRTTGTIDGRGQISVDVQSPAGEPPCPICLARGTRIATPDGDVAIEDVRVGMLHVRPAVRPSQRLPRGWVPARLDARAAAVPVVHRRTRSHERSRPRRCTQPST